MNHVLLSEAAQESRLEDIKFVATQLMANAQNRLVRSHHRQLVDLITECAEGNLAMAEKKIQFLLVLHMHEDATSSPLAKLYLDTTLHEDAVLARQVLKIYFCLKRKPKDYKQSAEHEERAAKLLARLSLQARQCHLDPSDDELQSAFLALSNHYEDLGSALREGDIHAVEASRPLFGINRVAVERDLRQSVRVFLEQNLYTEKAGKAVTVKELATLVSDSALPNETRTSSGLMNYIFEEFEEHHEAAFEADSALPSPETSYAVHYNVGHVRRPPATITARKFYRVYNQAVQPGITVLSEQYHFT